MTGITRNNTSTARSAFFYYSLAGALIGWFAVILQLWLIIVNRVVSIPETVLRFFSYFTILSNILAAICYTCALSGRAVPFTRFFTKPATLTAITVYISVVGIVYNIILRSLWDPVGWQQLADELLHSLSPLLFIVYWLVFIPKRTLRWSDVFSWLLFPLVYLIWSIIHGRLNGFYPYPFIDAATIGYPKLMLNSLILLIAFLGLSLLFVGIGRLMSRAARPAGE
ncbi:MAG TPA: Pr6Pr family membrane protein [Flavitalea sp.]|nr:Pr6Pr family membrane protein [Flavitalea sp.]